MIFNAEKIKKELECDSLVLSSNIYYFLHEKIIVIGGNHNFTSQ